VIKETSSNSFHLGILASCFFSKTLSICQASSKMQPY